MMGVLDRIREFFLLRGNIPALVVNRVIDSTGWQMFEIIFQPYVLSLGGSIPVLGLINSVYTGLLSVLQFGTGELSDSWGRKRLMMISYILSLIGIVVAYFAGSWEIMILHAVIAGVGDSLGEPSIMPLFAESVEEDQRGTAFSLLSLCWFLPGFYAYLLAGYLAEGYGNRLIIGILFVTEALSFLIFAFFVKETLTEKRPVELGNFFRKARESLTPSGDLGVFYTFSILVQVAMAMSGGIFIAMIYESTDLTMLQIGTLSMALAVSTTLMLIPAGKVVDRFGSKRVLIASTLLGIALYCGYITSPVFYGLLALQILRGAIIALFNPAYQAYLSNAVDESERGKVYGSLNGLKGMFSIPAPIVGAFLFEAYGFAGTFSVSLVLTLLALGLSFRIREQP